MSQSEDLESQPLLHGGDDDDDDDAEGAHGSKQLFASPTRIITARLAEITSGRRVYVHRGEVLDSMTYHSQDLASWRSLGATVFTIWSRPSLWQTALKLFGLSLLVALLTFACLSDPASLKVHRFNEVSRFLQMFVGLLLGFFMSASVNRWWACAESFLELFSAIRNLQFQLNSLGVPEDRLIQCLRYPVISAWVLHMQLLVAAKPVSEQDAAAKEGWEMLSTELSSTCTGGVDKTFAKLGMKESEILQRVGDPAGALWLWHGSLIGRLAADGFIPKMESPTYGRIMTLSQNGFDAVRDIRASVVLQAPFIYVQMLASLVHINNIVNAVAFGLTWGATMGTTVQSVRSLHWYGADATPAQSNKDLQYLLISFIFSCFGPFIYQALLEVSIAIAQPFSNKDAVVPTERLLIELGKDLHNGLMMSRKIGELGLWEPPHFKKPVAA